MASDQKLITLVTGANQGIGYYAAQQFASKTNPTHHVLVAARDVSKAKTAIANLTAAGVPAANLEPIHLDITDDTTIATAVETIRAKHSRLDILIHNAGISNAPGSLREQYAAIYQTNVFGPAAATEAFLPLLRASTLPGGKRIIFVSSSLSSLNIALAPDSPFPAKMYPIYRSSKTAVNMVMAGFASQLQDEGFIVGAVCPGYCGTNLNGYQGYKDPAEGASTVVRAAGLDREVIAGKLWHQREDAYEPAVEEGAYEW
ncbi:hypothetical protein B0A50_01536 [Salinomyces thailandicus]|uniref:NAD(P)-binding protein n=1 Tax=Salinomyces thailandicus TaxID=706561 RepID=A0A4U0UAL2_9PEZI|nr:hypothetical protein B0A50_01536 [Salinomyces thailandica]